MTKRMRIVHYPDRGSSKSKQTRLQAVRPEKRPEWFPPEVCGWSEAIDSLGCSVNDGHDLKQTFSLPPYHLFGGEAPHVVARKFHNFLRIRDWILAEVFDAPAHGQVMMGAMQWRVAIEGMYYFLEYSHLPQDVRPIAKAEDIAKLPLRPGHDDRNSNGKRERPSQGGSNRTLKNDRRTRDRVDINVRLNVHAGFPPYEETQTAYYLSRELRLTDVEGDVRLYAEVVWDLSVLHFRLEFLALDAICFPYSDHPPTPQMINSRQMYITSIWGGGCLTSTVNDGLTSPVFGLRASAILRLGECMQPWGFPSFGRAVIITSNSPEYQRREQETIIFYVRKFHAHFGRIPMVPLSPPPP